MYFPELNRNEQNSLKMSSAFLLGLFRRIFLKRKRKVFIIGFHKTGTSTLGKALQILGYTVCGSLKEAYDYDLNKDVKSYILEKAKPLLNTYDSFQDTPWFLIYKELYQLYPDAYFILTKRSENAGKYPNFWAVPMGHVEDGEKFIQGAHREFQEETKLDIDINSLVYLDTIKDTKYNRIVGLFTIELPNKPEPELDRLRPPLSPPDEELTLDPEDPLADATVVLEEPPVVLAEAAVVPEAAPVVLEELPSVTAATDPAPESTLEAAATRAASACRLA